MMLPITEIQKLADVVSADYDAARRACVKMQELLMDISEPGCWQSIQAQNMQLNGLFMKISGRWETLALLAGSED